MRTIHFILPVVLIAAIAGCKMRTNANDVLVHQTSGRATSLGATLTAPGNSAAPSTQDTETTEVYQETAPAPTEPPPSSAAVDDPEPVEGVAAPPSAAAPRLSPPPPAPPRLAWRHQKTTTSIGQHQDAAGIMKAATMMGDWSQTRWLGLLCILGAVGGLLYSHNNPEGYPVICWKVGGIGVFLAVIDPSPWWMLLLLAPAGFYLAQKLGLLRLPPLT